MLDAVLAQLRPLAHASAQNAHVPYSGRAVGAALLLADGAWVPGVRVESASFSLMIPAVLNALTTAVALGRRDAVALVQSEPVEAGDAAFLRHAVGGPYALQAPDAFVAEDADGWAEASAHAVGNRLSPFLDAERPDAPEAGVALARAVAGRAYVPESDFRVGCVCVPAGGNGLVAGVNVEHADWGRILCAERNALGTLLSYGLPPPETIYLSCPDDDGCSPCGACRQLLAELSASAALWMDRGAHPPQPSHPSDLLPGFFSGHALTARRPPPRGSGPSRS